MLGGLDDAKILDYFIHDFSQRYADDGIIHGAYGPRWRKHFGFDQLDAIVQRLIEKPTDRQCVIQMWDAHKDRANDLCGDWKDRPCNDVIFIRNNAGALDLTVCCRSNDMIWGAHGANAVHFSILQEYLAARCELAIGSMYQISNNAHVYLDAYNKIISRASPEQLMDDRYSNDITMKPSPMFHEPHYADEDIYMFLTRWQDGHMNYRNQWFMTTAMPAMMALQAHKAKDFKASQKFSLSIQAPDWNTACTEWLDRRERYTRQKKDMINER